MAILPNFDDGQISKTEISAKILKRKKIKFLLSESHQKPLSSRPE